MKLNTIIVTFFVFVFFAACNFQILAQHCPFDGGMVVAIHLTDENGEPFTDAKNISLVQKNKQQGKKFIEKPFLPAKENLTKIYGERYLNVYGKYACDEDCKLYEAGIFIAHLTSDETFYKVEKGDKIYWEKKDFEIQISHSNGQIRRLDVGKDGIYTLCYGSSKWTDIVPLEITELKPPQISLEISPYETEGCFIFFDKPSIKDKAEFLKAVRNDMSRRRCLEDLAEIDFQTHSLVNFFINSGHCRYPFGLKYAAFEDALNKKYLFEISYIKPNGPCRASSRYELWLLVPKIPNDYEIESEITARENTEEVLE